jgi:hypothetical protein
MVEGAVQKGLVKDSGVKSKWNLSNTEIWVGFELLTAIVMNVAIFWDRAPCSPHVNRHFGGKRNISIFRVENQPSNQPAWIRWLGRKCQHCTPHEKLLRCGTIYHKRKAVTFNEQNMLKDSRMGKRKPLPTYCTFWNQYILHSQLAPWL